MGTHLHLVATRPERFEDAGSVLAEIGLLVQSLCQDTLEELDTWEDAAGRPHLAVRLHPAADWVIFRDAGDGEIRVEAESAFVGPGHQVYVGEVVAELGASLGLGWRSLNGGGGGGDALASARPAAAREAALRWLRDEARARLASAGDGWRRPLRRDDGHRFEVGDRLATPLGPRDRRWLEEVAEDPERGLSVLPWVEPERGPTERLGRALYLLWTEVRFRPLLSEMEEGLLDGICEDLEEAHTLDPSLPYPHDTWRELYDLLDGAREMPRYVAESERTDGEPVGYRRGEVTVSIDGFELTVPGALAEEARDEGLWLGDRTRDVWMQGFDVDPAEIEGAGPEALLEGLPDEEGEPLPDEWGPGGLLRRAVVALDTEDGCFLHGACAVRGALVVLTIRFSGPDELPWATGVWRSVRAGRREGPAAGDSR